jgi:hypothetical protein
MPYYLTFLKIIVIIKVFIFMGKSNTMSRKISLEEFIERSQKSHGSIYDYSLSIYENAKTPITIICPVHGKFTQNPFTHMIGRGCSRCSAKKLAQKRIDKIGKSFIKKLKSVHGDRYDLSLVQYTGAKQMITVICPTHGKFSIWACSFVNGSHCQKCSYEERGKNKADTFKIFVNKAQQVHNKLYEYPQQVYKNALTHVSIKCSKHGIFSQVPNSHLSGNGCPRCVHHVSRGEKEISDFIKNLDPNLKTSVRSIIPPKEIDMYSEKYQIGIEYCGLYWHSEGRGKNKKYHLEKMNICFDRGVNLITIFEDEWLYHTIKIQSQLNHLFNATPRYIPAGKCKIIEMSASECQSFISSNHIQSVGISSIRYGLKFQNEIVLIMTFVKSRSSKHYQWEMSRFCSKVNTSVVGGANKLFSYFVKIHNPASVVTYVDLRYGRGNCYKYLEFEYSHNSDPNYWYVAPGSTIRESRNKYQKHKLVKEGYDPDMTEWEIMQSRGYDRIWDCGNAIWIWRP